MVPQNGFSLPSSFRLHVVSFSIVLTFGITGPPVTGVSVHIPFSTLFRPSAFRFILGLRAAELFFTAKNTDSPASNEI
jgi:hypothetical protein